jgi:hypothetical protein
MIPDLVPSLLAWRPFIDPLDAHGTWYLLLLPLVFFISMVWKAVRLPSLENYWRQVLMMTAQGIVGLVALALTSYLLVQVYVRIASGG